VFDNGEIRTDAPGVPQFRYAADAMFNRGAASTVFASHSWASLPQGHTGPSCGYIGGSLNRWTRRARLRFRGILRVGHPLGGKARSRNRKQ